MLLHPQLVCNSGHVEAGGIARAVRILKPPALPYQIPTSRPAGVSVWLGLAGWGRARPRAWRTRREDLRSQQKSLDRRRRNAEDRNRPRNLLRDRRRRALGLRTSRQAADGAEVFFVLIGPKVAAPNNQQ